MTDFKVKVVVCIIWFRSIIGRILPCYGSDVSSSLIETAIKLKLMIMSLIPRKTFQCDRCRIYTPTVKCPFCYPSPVFPLKPNHLYWQVL